MPAVVACGRTWEFGSDDLVFPAALLVAARSLWLVCQIAAVIAFNGAITCMDVYFVSVYVSLFQTVVLLIVESAIMFFSSRGSIRHTNPRRFIPSLLHFRVLLFMFEVMILVVKTVFVAQPVTEEERKRCPDLETAIIYTEVVVILTWVMFAVVLLAVAMFLDPCHCYSTKVSFDEMQYSDSSSKRWLLTHSVWEKRLRVVCCFAGSDDAHQVAYREVAEIFAHEFCDSKLVMSDIAAGMVLLQKEQIQREISQLASTDELDAVLSVPVNFADTDERETFKDALHFLKFAVGTYSWSFYLYMNPLCGCCSLAKRLSCRALPHVEEDHCCHCGLAAVTAMSGISSVDIVYASFENDLYKTPFMICIDHKTRSVVIAIRGTLSLHDIITDFCATTEHVNLPDFPQLRVHKGMHTTALCIMQKLDDGLLDSAFSKVPSYNKLVVAGHSLGSGVACLVASFLRERYPEVRCFCYSPTGSLLTAEGAAYTESFVTSVILGYDLVARLSVNTGHLLKEDIIRVLRRCSKPKYRILLEGGIETLCKCCGKMMVFQEQPPHDSLQNGSLSPLIMSTSSDFISLNVDTDEEIEIPPASTIRLFPPGKIIHIMDTLQDRGCFFGKRTLEARWVSSNSFERITVAPEMIRDHFPDALLSAMNVIWDQKTSEQENNPIEL